MKTASKWAVPDERFAETEFVVEASSEEMFSAWWKWSQVHLVEWEEVSAGFGTEIGRLDGRPVCVSVTWAWIAGKSVAFVEGTSQVVDFRLVDEWKNAVFACLRGGEARRDRHSNATNFGHAISFCLNGREIPRSHEEVQRLLGPGQNTSWHGPAARRRRGEVG